MSLLILLALAALLLFVVVKLYTRGYIVRTAAGLWLAFIPYELWIRAHCTGDCNIRVDLVLLLPVLLVVTVAASVSLVRAQWRKRKAARAGN